MRFKNTSTHYGFISKSFHTVMAIMIIGLLVVGLYMEDLDVSPYKFKLYGLHKSFGALVLALVILRLSWRLLSPPPGMLTKTMKDWEINLAKVIHVSLYFAMFLMPLSGWLMSSAANYPVSVFGLVQLPDLVAPGEERAELYKQVHELVGYTFILLIALHVLGALKHHFINKDNTLRRMMPFGVFVMSLVLISKPASSVQDSTMTWSVIKDKSHIKFISKQLGAEFEGGFEDFVSNITFNPNNLEAAKVKVLIPIESVNTQSKDRDQKIKLPEWFDMQNHTHAAFESHNITATTQPNHYLAKGTLDIKGIKRDFDLPFTLIIDGNIAKMQSKSAIQRLDWDLGTGDWADASFIGHEVKLDIQVTAIQN